MTLKSIQVFKATLQAGVFLLCISALSAEQPAVTRPVTATATVPASSPVATINGTPITEEELRKAAAADFEKFNIQIQQMRANLAREEHEILETNLIRILADKLFEAEASKKGISKEAFLEQELKGKVKEPTQEEIAAFYESNKQGFQKPLDQASDDIRRYLNSENLNKAKGDLADRLKIEYKAQMLLPPLRANVRTEGSPFRGLKEASVTIVEFADFQCPYCSKLSKTLHEAQTKFGDKIRLVYRQFPISQIHPFAEKAAEASFCAADQNSFWELHDVMFESQSELQVADLEAKAAKLKIDSRVFNDCLTSGKYAKRVQQDQREGYTLGVTGAPTVFINGRFFSGAISLSEISKIINDELSRNSLKSASAEAGTSRGKDNASFTKTP